MLPWTKWSNTRQESTKSWYHNPNITKQISRMILIHSIHYNDVIMSEMASQITSLTTVYSTVYSGADQRKHQRSASLAFVWGIHRSQGSVTRKMFPFHDVIMDIMQNTVLQDYRFANKCGYIIVSNRIIKRMTKNWLFLIGFVPVGGRTMGLKQSMTISLISFGRSAWWTYHEGAGVKSKLYNCSIHRLFHASFVEDPKTNASSHEISHAQFIIWILRVGSGRWLET